MKTIGKEIEIPKYITKVYKIFSTFILPIILLAIVGSVVTRNKPVPMQSTLLASGLANLVVLGFVTTTFISLGIEYIRHMNDKEWDRHTRMPIYVIFSKNILYGIFNFFYLFFWAFIFADMMHWQADSFFLSGDYTWSIDWCGVILSCILSIGLSIAMAIFIAQFIRNEWIFAGIGLLYFLAFGYLAGGMFGPGATYWMMIPGLLIPHAYIAHFFSGALTNGHYVVAHMPSAWDAFTMGGQLNDGTIDKEDMIFAISWLTGTGNLTGEQIRSIYVMENGSIWDLGNFQLNQWKNQTITFTGGDYTLQLSIPKPIGIGTINISHTFHLEPFTKTYRTYNSFYQISSLNIFLPIAIGIGCFSGWMYVFYIEGFKTN